MAESISLPRKSMLAIAVAQGLLLFALYKAFDLDVWPSEDPLWSFPLLTLVIVLPLLFLLSIEEGITKRVAVLTAGFGAVLALLAVYTGWQAEPFNEFPIGNLAAAFALSIAIACFKALMYLQQRAAQLPMSYQVLFTYSWRNFLVMALSAVFILFFWGILWLWAGLFKVIEIDFFAELFKKDWFIFPILGFANGLGIIIFRELTNVIDNITHLLQGLIKLLLPLIIGVAAVFLMTLPFTGLAVLWATGSGTALLLWLTAIILFFTNAVYQDGRGNAPYPDAIHRLIYIGLFVLPVLSALSFYGLWLRLDQYGWTVERCWAFVIWVILTMFCAGYIWGIVKRQTKWPSALGQVNTAMGWAILVLMLVVNSPLLDFRKISLSSQLARLDSGEIELGGFDFYYVHYKLARPGYLELQRIKSEIGDSDPQLLDKLEDPRRIRSASNDDNLEKFWDNLVYRPDGFEVPHKLRPVIERSRANGRLESAVILKIDLNEDGQYEYAVLPTDDNFYSGQYYWLDDGVWRQGAFRYYKEDIEDNDAKEMLKKGQIDRVDPKFKSLKIGDMILKPI